jgi:hypothetical protein
MSTYQQLRTWSPFDDCYIYRISVGNAHGHEIFMTIKDNAGARVFRARRAAALDAIQMALDDAEKDERDADPGEVRVPPDLWKELVDRAMMERAA